MIIRRRGEGDQPRAGTFRVELVNRVAGEPNRLNWGHCYTVKKGGQFRSCTFVYACGAAVENAEHRALGEQRFFRNVSSNQIIASRQVQRQAVFTDQVSENLFTRGHGRLQEPAAYSIGTDRKRCRSSPDCDQEPKSRKPIHRRAGPSGTGNVMPSKSCGGIGARGSRRSSLSFIETEGHGTVLPPRWRKVSVLN